MGRQITTALAREGARVAICARDEAQLKDTLAEFKNQGYTVSGSRADVTDEADVNRFYQDTLDSLGQPDILVNNVGGRRGSVDFLETTMEQFREGMEINLFSAVRLAALVLPHMKDQRCGRIINISSIYGREHGGSVDYMTGKAGMIAFSKHLALQLAPHRVLVNCVAPGSIDFPGSTWERFQQTQSPEVVSEFIARNLPMGQFG